MRPSPLPLPPSESERSRWIGRRDRPLTAATRAIVTDSERVHDSDTLRLITGAFESAYKFVGETGILVALLPKVGLYNGPHNLAIYACLCTCVCVCMCVCVHACMHVCMHVCTHLPPNPGPQAASCPIDHPSREQKFELWG